MNLKPFLSAPGIQYMQEDVLPFNNRAHLVNHLNYLFRTDQSQKWTNDHTAECTFSFYAQNGWITKSFSAKREIRDNWKQSIYNIIINHWGQNAYKNLAMGVSYFYDSKNNLAHVHTDSTLELTRLFTEETFSEFDNLQPLLYVCHTDQGKATHIHRLYRNKE